jgi:hypothetical protein
MGLLKFLGDKEKAFFDNADAALADPEVRGQLDKAEDAPLTGGLVRMAEGGYHLSHAAYDAGRGDTKGAFKEGIEGFAEYEHGVGQLGKDALDTTKDIMGMAGGGGGGDEAPAPQMNPYANGREESPRPRSKTQVMPRRRGNTKVMPREHEQQERSRRRGHTQVIPHQHEQQQRSRHGGGRR